MKLALPLLALLLAGSANATDFGAYVAQTLQIEQQALGRCEQAAGDQVTRFEVWHSGDGGAIIECYRIEPPKSVTEFNREEKIFIIHRYKFGSPLND